MAQRKKRITARKGKSTARASARKSSRSVRGKAAKRAATKLRSKKGAAKAKHPRAKKVARKKAVSGKPPTAPVVETTIVDVVEEPVPGVIAVTEFEETDIREASGGQSPAEED